MKILFWNIKNKELSDLLVELVSEQQVDILILAEANDVIVLNFIKKNNLINFSNKFELIKSSNDRLKILSRISQSTFFDKNNLIKTTRWSAHLLNIPTKIKLNLISIHFDSKDRWSDYSLALECANLANDIRKIETKTGCFDTILIGDFNMDPFEQGMVASNGINALQDKEYALEGKKYRDINGTKYYYFYNPMWSFFGCQNETKGTYYYRTPGHVSHEWHIFDQIILKPSLIKHINSIKIISNIGGEKLTKAYNRPDKKKYSDHLPVSLELNI